MKGNLKEMNYIMLHCNKHNFLVVVANQYGYIVIFCKISCRL